MICKLFAPQLWVALVIQLFTEVAARAHVLLAVGYKASELRGTLREVASRLRHPENEQTRSICVMI